MSFYEPRTQKAVYGNMIVWVLGALVLVGIAAAILFGVRWITASPKGQLQAREQIQSGGSRIAAYNHFFDLCAAIQAQEAALDAQYAELDGSTGGERDRIRANIAGLTAQRARSVVQYNVDARKGYTIGQFRASDLPYQIPAGKGATSCVA